MEPAPDRTPAKVESVLADVFKKLPKIRSRWPSEAVLSKTTQFNLFDGDKVIGVITLNAGTKVRILDIKQEHTVIRVGSHETPLPVLNTDLIDRMGGTAKILSYPDDKDPEKAESSLKSEAKKG